MTSTRKARPPTGLPNANELLDDPTNRTLLRELSGDPRLSMAELARRAGVSGPTAAERVSKMYEAGVITGVRLQIDQAALGRPVTAFVRVRPFAGRLDRIIAIAREIPDVVECHRITGEDCFLVRVCLPRVEDLDRVLDQFLLYGQTTTSIVQSVPVPLRALPL